MNLTIQPLSKVHYAQLCELAVSDEQQQYVGTMEGLLACVSMDVHPHVICVKDQVIGFFLIDTFYGIKYDFANDNAIGLRGFFIDQRYQGKGYAKATMGQFGAYLKNYYSHRESIYLTVNCRNPFAKQSYLSGGFIDTGELYLGGAAGPQHIMKLTYVS